MSSTDHWYEDIDHSNVDLIIFLDFKKAFDTIDYHILLIKLRAYGIKGKTGDWIESYLNKRQRFCTLNGQHSKTRNVTCGILQGSCFGPLLFIIYLNDFEKCLKLSRASIYADDTNITIALDDVAKLIEDAHQELSIHDFMNSGIHEFMIMGQPLKDKNLDLPEVRKLNNCDIKRVEKSKSLGVIIDEKLNWDEQFRRTTSKMSGGLAELKKVQKCHSKIPTV